MANRREKMSCGMIGMVDCSTPVYEGGFDTSELILQNKCYSNYKEKLIILIDGNHTIIIPRNKDN